MAYVGASIGIAIGPEHGQEGITLMDRADVALYRTKEKGWKNFWYQSVSITGCSNIISLALIGLPLARILK
ncbi:hypothetical protein CCP4SC76_5180030 [Gammaproteobacteria bacterium]